jgi:hypothetical protein
VLAGLLAGEGRVGLPAGLAAAAVWGVAAGALRLGRDWAAAAGYSRRRAHALGATPLAPWIVAWPLLALALVDPLARQQIMAARLPLALYLAGWLAAGLGGLALWIRVASPAAARACTSGTARNPQPPPGPAAGGWWLAVPLLAFAATAYWNGAVLDPLQFRGFPDYVTQMGGARRLLAGALPYDPAIRVWTDVNLPPITLLVLFAPFTLLSEMGGKLAYFLLNHLAFLGGLGVLLAATRTRAPSRAVAWSSVLAAALAFEPWHDSVRLGQQNGIVFCLLAAAAAALMHGRDSLAGVALAAALIGKPSSALLGLYLVFARRWRAVLACAAAGALAFAVTLPWTGIENWRFYLLEKAPQILAGTPQQSNVALLALHARLFLPADALSSFDAMPALPAAQLMTRVAQALGALALWRLTRPGPGRAPPERAGVLLEFSVALVLSLSLVGHAWQSYVTWLVVAVVALAQPIVWAGVPGGARGWVIGLAAASYAALALDDVALYKTIGNTSGGAPFFASLPNAALLALAFALALLRAAHRRATGGPAVLPSHRPKPASGVLAYADAGTPAPGGTGVRPGSGAPPRPMPRGSRRFHRRRGRSSGQAAPRRSTLP